MDVYQDMVLGGSTDKPMHPVCPVLVREMDKTELDALQTPFLILREERGALLLERMLIDIDPDAHSLFRSISDNLRHIDRYHDLCRIRIEIIAGSVPFPVVKDIVDAVPGGEVDAGLGVFGSQARFAEDLAGLDPVRVGELAGFVQVKVDVILLQQAAQAVGSHHHTPGHGIGRDEVRARIVQCHGKDMRPHQTKLSPREINDAGLSDGRIQVVGELQRQRSLALLRPSFQGPFLIERLGPQMVPGLGPGREGELGVVGDNPVVQGVRMSGQGVTEGDSLIIGPELDIQRAE